GAPRCSAAASCRRSVPCPSRPLLVAGGQCPPGPPLAATPGAAGRRHAAAPRRHLRDWKAGTPIRILPDDASTAEGGDMELNWLAVVAAAVSAFVLGGIWYGPLFLKAWSREAGIAMEANKRHPAQVFGLAFAAALVSAA